VKGIVPNFFVIGVPKGGTTSLYHYLNQHADVFMSEIKEPAFFSSDYNYRRGVDWYVNTFFRRAEGRDAVGEATPSYFCNKKVVQRIVNDLPASSWRFLVILRDPVARAYSMYWDLVRAGVERGTFEEALERESERLTDPEVGRKGSFTVGYRYVGDYASHLAIWIDVFGPERLLVLLQEDLLKKPVATMREVFSFLGVSPDAEIDTSMKHNPASAVRYPRLRNAWRAWRSWPRWTRGPLNLLPERTKHRLVQMLAAANRKPWTYPPLSERTERQLRASFETSVCRLEELLDLDLSHWKPSPSDQDSSERADE
jgi:hypothetical protein